MLMLELMSVAAGRYRSGPGWSAVVGDAGDQARHAASIDAPDTVQDGMEWYVDEDDPDCCGPVPRLVELREQPNVRVNLPATRAPQEKR